MYTVVVRLLWSDNKCRHGLCAFPNMVSNVNTMRKSGKNQKKSGKKGETWCHVADNVRYSLHGLCAFPNMGIKVNIATKSGKNKEKKERHDVKLLIMLRYSLHGLGAFPNMVNSVNLMRKSGIVRRKE